MAAVLGWPSCRPALPPLAAAALLQECLAYTCCAPSLPSSGRYDDYIALFPAGADPAASAPIKYHWAARSPSHIKLGEGSLRWVVPSSSGDMARRHVRVGGGGFWCGCCRAAGSGEEATQSTAPPAPAASTPRSSACHCPFSCTFLSASACSTCATTCALRWFGAGCSAPPSPHGAGCWRSRSQTCPCRGTCR